MNNKRNKRGPVRTQRNRSVTADGVYGNQQFMFIAAAQVGAIVRIKTRNEEVWEGVFKTFSSGFDVVLEVATLIGKSDIPNTSGQASSLAEKLVFPVTEIVSLTIRDVDPTYATKDTFQTDAAISARLNGAGKEERELEPWDGELNGGADTPLELDGTANGWDANEMFKKNETDYGVTSSFDHSLRGYTVQLQHSDTPDYKEAEAKANQIANEIESQPSRKARLELENGDEEAIYAAVVRPSEPNGKYIPPAKRKTQTPAKMTRNSPPPPNNAVGGSANSPTMPTPAQNTASKGAQTSPVTAYVNNAPVQNMAPPQAVAPPPTQHMAVQSQQQQVQVLQQQMQVQNHQQQQPQQQQQQPQRQNHGYGNRQGGTKGGQHMNGEASKVQRGPRNVYQAVPPPNVQQQQVQHPVGAYQEMQPKMVEMNHSNHNNRHHNREEVKDLQQFAQDFQMGPKEAPPQGPPPQQQIAEQIMPPCAQPPQPNLKQQQQPEVPPAQPQPSPSPQSDGAGVDKVATALKKSTLNPNAKEFVLNPTAKPFMPRLVSPKQYVAAINNDVNGQRTNENQQNATVYSFNSRTPSTSSLSRPHTPQTPSHAQFISTAGMNGPPMGQPPASMILPMGYMMPGQAQYPQQPQGNRMRKIPAGQIRGECLSQMSQMQVAAATGQPLLAPAPISQFVYQPAGINPAAYHQMQRMYDPTHHAQLQYLSQQASQAGGGQPGQPQYAQGQPPQAPPQQYQAAPPPQGGVQTHQYLPMCNIIPQPHMLQGMQYIPQVPPPQHPIPLILHNQQHQVHQGPA